MKKVELKIALASLALLALLPAQQAFAGFNDGSSVTMGGKPVFSMAADEGFSAEHRAHITQDALDNALVVASNRTPSAVTVERSNGALIIALDGKKVATVDANSAAQANKTPEQLADDWANSIKNFLADSSSTANYLATLTGKNPVEGSIAIIERRLYAPQGLAFGVHFLKDLRPSDLTPGDMVEAVVDNDVPMGHYVIPAKTIVIGEVVDTGNDTYKISFVKMRTPSGTVVPIDAYVTAEAVLNTKAPHLVCTYVIPSGTAVGKQAFVGRVPASIAVGAPGGKETYLVFSKDSSTIVASQPMTLVFEKSMPVAVITRD
ncbi:MAG: hypothetical protein K2X81_17960, partial [Candidatus Obscuribacterales bacterium]|nr:hypothetical protein [Candidatus Obscuribacterales bacterium]